MMLPAREFPEKDLGRTGPQGAAGTPAEASADSGRSTRAHKTVRAGNAVQAGKTGQAGKTVQAGKTGQAGAGFPGPDDAVDAAAGREWSDVLAMFVDDPRGSVAEASAMVDEAINAFVATARERQASLAALWQAQNADTEQLRRALRDYRTFWTSVAQLPQPA